MWNECVLCMGTFLSLVYLHCHLVVPWPLHPWDLLVLLSQKRLVSPGLVSFL